LRTRFRPPFRALTRINRVLRVNSSRSCEMSSMANGMWRDPPSGPRPCIGGSSCV
jgi:hypothetical protein